MHLREEPSIQQRRAAADRLLSEGACGRRGRGAEASALRVFARVCKNRLVHARCGSRVMRTSLSCATSPCQRQLPPSWTGKIRFTNAIGCRRVCPTKLDVAVSTRSVCEAYVSHVLKPHDFG